MIAGEGDFEFIFEGGDSLVLKKSEVICWDEFAEGQTAVIRSREDAMSRMAASIFNGTQWAG
ncbi:MAG TPA: hypothetical protein VK956_12120 [Verrucomicrobium sp.]|nr:hypothetical protein [Verrucomicrobium sp.]